MHEIDEMLKLQLEGRHTEARALSDKLEKLGPDRILDPTGNNSADIWLRHSFNRGWFLINDGDYQKGCQALENGRFINVYGSPPLKTNAPIYNPNEHEIKGKSILISLEGGYGDEIIHARFATSFKNLGASHVYIASSPELISVFERIQGVDKVILRNQVNSVAHDYWVPGFSAGWIAGHDFDNFPGKPYLAPIEHKVDEWKNIINSDKIKVGIRWAGNPAFEHQQFRKFPESFITNLHQYPELQLYSFQKDANLVPLPDNVIDLQDKLSSWEDTMAAIANLDILITSCTSVAHMSAAMGIETWVLTPILPYHTWTYKSPSSRTSPYYDSVKLFRQTAKLKWNDTFQLLYKELEEKFNLTHIDFPNQDRVPKRLNMGCGLQKMKNFVNADISPIVNPDVVVDFNKLPWPFEDNEFDHIIAKDILEHLGETGSDFVSMIKEMYRVSHDGAIWEIQSPHWRSDTAIDDPDHKRLITLGMFKLFDKESLLNRKKAGNADSLLAFEQNIDISVQDYQFIYSPDWDARIKTGKVTQQEVTFALNYNNNVATSVQYLIQVHKPGRISDKEFNELVEQLTESELSITLTDNTEPKKEKPRNVQIHSSL